jgi:hypothetical protein
VGAPGEGPATPPAKLGNPVVGAAGPGPLTLKTPGSSESREPGLGEELGSPAVGEVDGIAKLGGPCDAETLGRPGVNGVGAAVVAAGVDAPPVFAGLGGPCVAGTLAKPGGVDVGTPVVTSVGAPPDAVPTPLKGAPPVPCGPAGGGPGGIDGPVWPGGWRSTFTRASADPCTLPSCAAAAIFAFLSSRNALSSLGFMRAGFWFAGTYPTWKHMSGHRHRVPHFFTGT